jgi:hypothetical protein
MSDCTGRFQRGQAGGLKAVKSFMFRCSLLICILQGDTANTRRGQRTRAADG